MAGLFARGGEWKQCLPEWTEEELKAMEANGGVLPVEMRAPAEGEDPGAVDVGEAGDPAVSPEAAAQLSRAARAVVAEPAMTSEERMDYLRARGVIIETHEERTEKAAAAAGGAKAAPVALRKEDQFCYMKIPHDIKEPVEYPLYAATLTGPGWENVGSEPAKRKKLMDETRMKPGTVPESWKRHPREAEIRAQRPDLPDWMFEERKMPNYADVDPDKVELRR